MSGEYANNIHKVLAHSYAVNFILFLIGVALDIIFRFPIFTNSGVISTGATLLVLGSILILWAQHTSRNLKKENITKESFMGGPYSYTRSPTHWGLFFMMLGFGIIANAVFVVLTTLLSFLVSRLFFLPEEERLLLNKYGTPYLEYKKLVTI